MGDYTTLLFTSAFLDTLTAKEFTAADRRRFLQAVRLLDTNERHPSLRIHQLQGDMAGLWSASASDALRITFERIDSGQKRLIACSRHYQ
jgi:hypothetical protein